MRIMKNILTAFDEDEWRLPSAVCCGGECGGEDGGGEGDGGAGDGNNAVINPVSP